MRNAGKFSALALGLALLLGACGKSTQVMPDRSKTYAEPTSPAAEAVPTTAVAQPGSVLGVSGTLVTRAENQPEDRWSFFLGHDGSYRFEASAAGIPGEAYDARSAAIGEVDPQGKNPYPERKIEVAPGPPDRWPYPVGILNRVVGWTVRALAVDGNPAVTETTWKGRRAWRFSFSPKATDAGGSPEFDRVEVVVDVETALPLEVVGSRDAQRRSIVTIEGLNTKASLPLEALEVATAGARSEGFKRVTLEEATEVAGFVPYTPTALPSGYRLAEVAVSTASGSGEGENNVVWRGPVVSLAYRRGIDEIVVTSRATGPDAKAWEEVDPLAGEGTRPAQVLTLQEGPLSKAIIDAQVIPHAWGVMNGLVVTVAGTVSAGELSKIAASFR